MDVLLSVQKLKDLEIEMMKKEVNRVHAEMDDKAKDFTKIIDDFNLTQ